MASFEIIGKLVAKYDTVQRTATFKTREFAIEISEDANGRVFTNYVKFQCVQDRTEMLDRYDIGSQIKVTFNLRGTKWEKNGQINYITNLDAWRIEAVQLGSNTGTPAAGANFTPDNFPADQGVDDLPF
ncbi:DUF3127 domain-containing protein [Rhizosphaericola mali]|uniref:DUF3127 domain-containing protein n=1 Tax=Rhizosphaericola mali TaxID=2545455 RepID=A0A5P2FWD5_9BACT|nr:DUF3127 domain-containing protein [Rhizosphaericola mali]QES87207.1 DUF3127 domain-containing protein [Rhizosphaericola mali]